MPPVPKPAVRPTAFAVVYRKLDDGRWEASIPDMPGVTAVGKDIDAAKSKVWNAGKQFLKKNPLMADLIPTTVVGYVHPSADEAPARAQDTKVVDVE